MSYENHIKRVEEYLQQFCIAVQAVTADGCLLIVDMNTNATACINSSWKSVRSYVGWDDEDDEDDEDDDE